MKRKQILAVCAIMLVVPMGAAQGEPPWERGRGVTKYEYEAGGCKYEYKATPGMTKEEYKCKGRGGPPPWVRGGYRVAAPPALPPINLGRCSGETAGHILGGLLGGLAGSRFGEGSGKLAAVAGGTLLGYLIGGEIGRSIDANDRACANQVFETVPAGQPVIWTSPRHDREYVLTPAAPYDNNGQYCREYQAEVTVGGRRTNAYGTACRQPDGSWKIVS